MDMILAMHKINWGAPVSVQSTSSKLNSLINQLQSLPTNMHQEITEQTVQILAQIKNPFALTGTSAMCLGDGLLTLAILFHLMTHVPFACFQLKE